MDYKFILILIFFMYISLIWHEIGHCIWAKLAKINSLNKVSIGMGKEIFKFNIMQIKVTIRQIPIPFGTFGADDSLSLKSLNTYQVLIIQLGGVLNNFIIAMGSFMILALLGKEILPLYVYDKLSVVNMLRYLIYVSKWIISNGINNLYDLITHSIASEVYKYIFIIGIVNNFIFIMNIIPVPMGVNKQGKILFTDGGQILVTLIQRSKQIYVKLMDKE